MPQLTALQLAATQLTASQLRAYQLGSSIDGSAGNWMLEFNGIDIVADTEHAEWNTSGFGDSVELELNLANVPAANTYLIDGTDETLRLYVSAAGALIASYEDVGATNRLVTGPSMAAGVDYDIAITTSPDDVVLTVNGTDYTSAYVPAMDQLMLTHIGGAADGTTFIPGVIKNLKYTNATPLQNTNAVQGSVAVDLYAKISKVELLGDFSVTMWWVRENNSVSDDQFTGLIGEVGSTSKYIAVYDTAHASTPSALRLNNSDVTTTFTSALENIAIGQHVKIKVVKTGTDIALYLDDELVDTQAGSDQSYEYTQVGAYNTNQYTSNGIIYDVIIEDRTQAVTLGDEIAPSSSMGSDWSDDWVSGAGTTLVGIGGGIVRWGVYGGTGITGIVQEKNATVLQDETYYQLTLSIGTVNQDGGPDIRVYNYSADETLQLTADAQSDDVYEAIFYVPAGGGARGIEVRAIMDTGQTIELDTISVKPVTKHHTLRYDMRGDDGDLVRNIDPDSGVLGSELVAGGDMGAPFTDWPSLNSPTTNEQTTAQAYSGEYSRHIVTVAASNCGASQTINGLVAGKIYAVSARVYPVSGTVRIDAGDSDFEQGGAARADSTGTGAWEYLSFTAQATGTSATIKLQNASSSVTEAYWDDVSVKETTDGLWQNYDQGTDQVALPQLSRYYKINEGPGALYLEDRLNRTGANIVTNGDFSDGLTGWTVDDSGAGATVELVDGAIHIVSTDGSQANINRHEVITIGEMYLVEFDAVVTSGLGKVQLGSGQPNEDAVEINTTGHYSVLSSTASSTSTHVYIARKTACDFTLDNLVIRNINTGAVLNNVANNDWVQPIPAKSLVHLPLVTSLAMPKGEGALSYGRTGDATFTDWEGVVRTAPENCPRFQGARMVRNRASSSEDFSAPLWLKGGGASITGTQILNLPSDYSYMNTDPLVSVEGLSMTASAVLSGSGTVHLQVGTGNSADASRIEVTLTSTPTRYEVTHTLSADNATKSGPMLVRRPGDTATQVTISNIQCENVTGQADKTASEYVSNGVLSDPYHGSGVDGIKFFDTDREGVKLKRSSQQYAVFSTINDSWRTPDSAASSITGDIDIQVHATIAWSGFGSNQHLVNKYVTSGNQRSYRLRVQSNGTLVFIHSPDGATFVDSVSTVANPFSDGDTGWVRVTRSASTGDVKFYTRETEQDSWTQLGDTVSTSVEGIYDSTAVLDFSYASQGVIGNIHRGTISDTIDGDPVVDFNPADWRLGDGTSFDSSTTGETWSTQADAYIWYPIWMDESGPYGFINESAATNLSTHSEDHSEWESINVDISGINFETGPTGAPVALLKPSVANDYHLFRDQFSSTSGTTYTVSCFVKAGGYDYVQVTGSAGFLSDWYNVNLKTGLVESSSGASIDVKVVPKGNGWWRISATAEAIGSVTDANILFAILEDDAASRLPTYIGDTVGGVYASGMQIEEGSHASAYIPTDGATATRNRDEMSLPATDNILEERGQVDVEVSTFWKKANTTSAALAKSGNGLYAYQSGGASSTSIRAYDGVNIVNAVNGDLFYAVHSVVTTWQANSMSISNDGTADADTYSGDFDSSSNTLGIGSRDTYAFSWNGTIRNLVIYDKVNS